MINYNDYSKTPITLTLENGENVEGEIIEFRVNPQTIPQGKEWYHIRHTDEDWIEPATIKNGKVMVNFFATLICDEIPNLNKDEELDIIEHFIDYQ